MRPKIKTFRLFQNFPNLLHAFSTRQEGFSSSPFDKFNLGLHTNDDQVLVLRNRSLFFNYLNIHPRQLVFPEQVHSDHVEIVQKAGIVPSCDGIITNRKNLFLTIQTADCFPVFLFGPQCEVVALIHSGWRGTAKNIVGKAVQKMSTLFNCQVSDILAAIGPGIQQSCYQVGRQLSSLFKKRFLIPDGKEHFLLDVQGAIVSQLQDAGIPEDNIEYDITCTHCAADLYYSYRRDGKNSGRMMGVLGMRALVS